MVEPWSKASARLSAEAADGGAHRLLFTATGRGRAARATICWPLSPGPRPPALTVCRPLPAAWCLLLAVLALSACGSDTTPPRAGQPATARRQTLARPPQRIVSIVPAVTEMLF